MLSLTMESLLASFKSDWAKESKFVGLLIDIDGAREVIINSKDNYDKKAEYYEKTYDENLYHRHAKEIRIVGYTFGYNFAEIQEDLLGGSLDEIYGR